MDKQPERLTQELPWLRLSDHCVIPSDCLSTEVSQQYMSLY